MTVLDNQPRPLLERLADFTNPVSNQAERLIHSLHPYPAKYIPQLPHAVISEHTNERHVVLDPFCGSGTTLVEASLLGRRSVGSDSNPIATLITRAKTTRLEPRQILILNHFLAELGKIRDIVNYDWEIEELFPRHSHWFQNNVSVELLTLRTAIHEISDESVRTFLLSVFSSIIVSVSNQESDTRYAAKAKNIRNGYVFERFAKKLASSIEAIQNFSEYARYKRGHPQVYNIAASDLTNEYLDDNSIDLIVTSPPYPNSYDYYLYHKMRMFWLGFEPKEAQRLEIGSRHEHSSKKAGIDVFVSRMRPVVSNLARVLKPSKLAYLFVGDSVIGGVHYDMTDVYADIAASEDFGIVGHVEYDLQDVTRSFRELRFSKNNHNIDKKQRVLVLECRRSSRPAFDLRHVASPKAKADEKELGSARNGDVIAIKSDDTDRHVHSLVSYPSKFIPEIPAWAIQEFSLPGQTILDPFSGSGTTAVEAALLNRNAISVDYSPYAAMVTRAKTSIIDPDSLKREAAHLEAALTNTKLLPLALRKNFELDDFWFDVNHLQEFARIRAFIENIADSNTRQYLLCILSTTIRQFSFQDAGQIKVKRDGQKVIKGTPSPSKILLKKLAGAVTKKLSYMERVVGNPVSEVYAMSAGDYASRFMEPSNVDLIVTSPPYINAMNYSMANRYELLLLDLVQFDELRSHQSGYFGTERVYSKNYNILHQFENNSTLGHLLNEKLELIYRGEPKRSYITYLFFANMQETFRDLTRKLKDDGRIVMVVGTNTIKGIPIDTFGILNKMIEDQGFEMERYFYYDIVKQQLKITRHKTAKVIPHDGIAVLRKI